MSRDNDNDSSSFWESPLEIALWQISILDMNALSIEDKLKTVAAIFLSAMDVFLTNGGSAVIAQEARGIYENAIAETPALAADIRAIPREKIAQLVDAALPALNPQSALAQAHIRKLVVQELNGADLALVAQALQSVLPPALKTLLLNRGLIDNTPTGEWAKAMIKTIASTSAADLAKTYNAAARQVPRDVVTDRLYDITSHMTEDKLSTLFGHIKSHYPVEDFVALAVSGLNVLRHVLEDVSHHGVPTRMSTEAKKDLANWGQELGRFLTVFEDALHAAGLSRDLYAVAETMVPQASPPPAPPQGPAPKPAGP